MKHTIKIWNEEEIKSFKKACQPIIDWLNKNGTPYKTVIIDETNAQLVSEEITATFELKD